MARDLKEVIDLAHLTVIDAATALGALLVALGAKLVGVDGEFFALAAAVVGVALGLAMGKAS